MNRLLPLLMVGGLLVGPAQAQNARSGPDQDKAIIARARPAVDRGVNYLKGHVNQLKDAGEAGISALAMIKAGVAHNDQALLDTIARFAVTFKDGGYQPETKGGPDTYEASVVCLALVNLEPIDYKPQIDLVAQYLMGKQMPNGAWDYSNRSQGDESMTQYALLALWEAENAGIVVRPEVWDHAARYFLSVESSSGSWTYHRDAPNQGETVSMSAAGVGSLLICQEQLARHRKGQDLANPLMIPITIDGQPAESRYKVQTSVAEINNGIAKGMAWLASHFEAKADPSQGQSPYYALYGIERLAALDDKGKRMEATRWYERGVEFALSSQKGSGAWDAQHAELPNTCWAVLFATKATVISREKIKIRKLAGAPQRPGTRMPSDLSNVEIVGGEIVVKPMGGAIENMLKILEDPSNMKFESALAGLEVKYQAEGPKVLRPLKDRFRKLLTDKDPYNRMVAAWGLGRTADLDVAPILIKTLLDSNPAVVSEARIGLQVLSRKLDGFGPVADAPPEERLAAARRWQTWFNSVKPPELDAPDDILPAPAPGAAGAKAAK